MLELGHSLEYVDSMGAADVGAVMAYWSGKSKAEEKQAKERQRKSNTGGRRGRRR